MSLFTQSAYRLGYLFLPKFYKVLFSTSFSMSRYVIYDCDIGTDDAWGLMMLIKGEQVANKQQNKADAAQGYKIIGVTCVNGNTDVENVTKNALRCLDAFDRTDIPVFKGCGQAILAQKPPVYFHGLDGLGDVEHEKDVATERVQQKHAVNAMYQFACQYPNMVDYILVGPLTNFAMCIKMYESEFLNKVRSVHIMGGNIKGKGNITKSAEFNFWMDPEAAHIVLENIQKIPLSILPWETCIDGNFGITLDWRLNVLGAAKSKAIEFLNRVERAILIPKGFVNWVVCDAMLTAAYIFPTFAIAKSRSYYATVELTGTHTRGQMVLDHLRQKTDNATVILEIHRGNWRKIITWTAGVPGSNIEDLCE